LSNPPTPSYDLVFAGNIAFDEIHPFGGEAHTLFGSAVYFAAMAAAWSDRKLAMVARMAEQDVHLLDQIRKTRIAVHISPSAETTRHGSTHLSANVDERDVLQLTNAGHFTMADLPPMEPTLVHLASVTDADFTVDFIRDLKRHGFSCAVDMQGFVRKVDGRVGRVSYSDVAEKQEIARMACSIKLDVLEALYLTGTADQEQAAIQFEEWGTSETMVTSADGVLVRYRGESYRERFTNRSVVGRTGRGDSVFASYLARRLDHGVADSLRFAAALASMKVEASGPFLGTEEQVLKRMETDHA
jgi:sugar/nucleoside kinase (ribokinase family)